MALTRRATAVSEDGGELRSPVGHHVDGETMDPEDVLEDQFRSFLGRG